MDVEGEGERRRGTDTEISGLATFIEVAPGTRGCAGQDEWDHGKSSEWIFDVLSFRNQWNSQSRHVVDVLIDEGLTVCVFGGHQDRNGHRRPKCVEVKESQSENRGLGWYLRDTGVTRKGRRRRAHREK